MRARARGFIADQEAAYIQLLLGHVEPEGKEKGLERLCSHYRKGYRLREPHSIQQTLTALLYNSQPKVRRWSLNAIAQAGSRTENLQAVLDCIQRDRNDEDVMAAGIGALIYLTKDEERPQILRKIDVALEGPALLAAAQQASVYQGELAVRRVSVDCASPAELRLASVLIGLDKAPEHLFSLTHENSAIIGRLNIHDDPMVAQYSTWAICESDTLNISHLATPIKDIETRPDRVRSYTYKLLTADAETAESHREYIELGAADPSPRSRAGLAAGLSRTFFDGLEEVTLNWYDAEHDQTVKDLLLDHMVAHSHCSTIYCERAMSEYATAGIGSMKRARLEAIAEGQAIFAAFKKIAIQAASLSLFSDAPLFGGLTVNNIKAENMNIGVLAGDHSSVNATVTATQNNRAAEAGESLQRLSALLASAEGSAAIEEGKRLTSEAAEKPSKGTVTKVLSWMKQLKEGTGYAVATGDSFVKIQEHLNELLDFLL